MEGAALDDLYDDNGTHSGINWAAIIATAVGAVIGLVNVDISFFTATIPTGLVYYFLHEAYAVLPTFQERDFPGEVNRRQSLCMIC